MGFRLLAHTSDLGLRAWGPDLLAALFEAVRALGTVLAGASAGHAVEERAVAFAEPDEESPVVSLLQEALYLLEAEGWLSVDAVLAVDASGALTGHLRGEPFDAVRHAEGQAVKAVTWHGLSVAHTPERVAVTVYLDL